MHRLTLDLTFTRGKGLDDLLERLEAMSRSVFSVAEKRLRKGRSRMVWVHVRLEGRVTFREERGLCWAEIGDRADGQFTGAVYSWIVRNARDLIPRIYCEIRPEAAR